jgi:hypothetical protein
LPGDLVMPREEKNVPWARHKGVIDREAGKPCRKYKDFRMTYNLPESEFTLRMWLAYKPPKARKASNVGQVSKARKARKRGPGRPTSYEKEARTDRINALLRKINPPEAIRDSWR